MRKFALIILSVLMFAVFSNSTMAEEITLEQPEEKSAEPVVISVITAPKWEEFCESGYENAAVSVKKDVLNVVSFVQSERDKKTYWAERRTAFEKFLNHCKTLVNDNERAGCYSDLRRLENNKNEVYYSNRQPNLYQTNFVNQRN